MSDALYLAWRYLVSAPARTWVLIFGSTVALFLPIFTGLAAARLQTTLLARAEASPILLGAAGGEFELTVASLYFRRPTDAGSGPGREADGGPAPVPFGLVGRVDEAGYGLAVPLHVGHSAGGAPVVGTVPEYFEKRGLEVERGRPVLSIGEVVAGAEVARQFRLQVGDRMRSDLSNLYDLAGAYPLLLEVVGILAPSDGPDDVVFFTGVETSWALDGLFHGHEAISEENALPGALSEGVASSRPGDSPALLAEPGNAAPGRSPAATDELENLEASAALFLFAEIDDRNRQSFHLHGDPDQAPLTSVLVFPNSRRDHDQLLGDFALEELYQAIRPVEVVGTLLELVLRLRRALGAYFALVAVATAAFVGLVLWLSTRLRRDELRLLERLGASRLTVATLLGTEMVLVLGAAALLTALGTWGGLAWLDAFLRGG